MNKSREILSYLKQPGSARSLILAPNAPPIARSYASVTVALNIVMDAEDISNTLEHLYSEALPAGTTPKLTGSGTFSFGQKGVGRIRVTYATQRGSYVVAITSIPFVIPKPEQISTFPDKIVALAQAASTGRNVFVAVSGNDQSSNDTFIYSVLQAINESSRNIIAILERNIAYLMGHMESIVMQAELGVDTPTVAAGMAAAADFQANIIYLSNVEEGEDHPSIRKAVANGNVVILNSTSLTPEDMAKRYVDPIGTLRPPADPVSRFHVRVFPCTDGMLDVRIESVT